MDMSKFRPESHVAQQSRREKLRVQHLEEFPNSLDQHQGLSPDLVQVRNVRNANLLYDPTTLVTSNLIHFSTTSNVVPPPPQQRDAMQFSSHVVSGHPQGQGQGCSNWKSGVTVGSHNSSDWTVGYNNNANAGGLVGRESNQNPMFVGQVLSNNANLKPNHSSNYHDVQSTLSNPGSEISSHDSKRQFGDLQFASPSLYHNPLHDVVTTASLVHQNYCGDQSTSLHFDGASAWMNRPLALENCQQWRIGATDATTQGLSLSLSSNPTPKICGVAAAQLGEDYGSDEFKEPQDSKASMLKPSTTSKGCSGKSLQDSGGNSSYVHKHTGPLGPFTGYATILKNSRFLRPAQELMDEFCHMTSSKLARVCETSEGVSGEVSASASASADAANAVDMEVGASKGNNSGASSSSFYGSSDIRVDVGSAGSSSGDPCRPEYQQKKAKLLYLQEEVCRRYKLYHQQMQMVVSSFESVAGLSAATPYISLALKSVTRNFRCLRNAISDQIRHISRALGEDLLSPTTGTSSSKGDINVPRPKYVGQKSGGVNMTLLEPQQHGWRPQRGLPERSVAILRAWLFEHFLHPYPTDTDKHMLATQTGLSRNQVSNWFINARVRVWKPMVEEIHMLESKGMSKGNQNMSSTTSDGKCTSSGGGTSHSMINRSCINVQPDHKQLSCSEMQVAHGAQEWNHEKRSRMDFHNIPTTMENSMMPGFAVAPYQQSRVEMVGGLGLGAVSLTLGLRHGVESAQQQQQQQQYQRQEDQLRRQFGGQMIHDFAG